MLKNLSKVYSILNSKQKIKLVLVLMLILISVFLESLSVGLIIPIMGIITNPNFFENFPYVVSIFNIIGAYSKNDFIFITLLFLGFFFIIKLLFSIFYTWYFSNYILMLKAHLSKKLFTIYLHNEYDFFLKTNSSILIRNIQEEISYCISAVKNFSMLFIEFLVVIGISSLLIFYQTSTALLIILFSILIGFLFYYFTNQTVKNWSIKRQKNEALKLQHLHQGIFGIKELKILNIEKYFINNFNLHNIKLAKISIIHDVFRQMPRIFLESFAVIIILSIFFYLFFNETNLNSLITTVALFGAAGFRILPSLNRIIQAFQDLSFTSPSIDVVHSEIKKNFLLKNRDKNKFKTNLTFSNNILIENISFAYNKNSSLILDNINLKVNKNDRIGIIGKSGQGKSTLADLILGLINPSSGNIKIDNIKLDTINFESNLFGYVPQNIYLTDDTILNNIAFGVKKNMIDMKKINSAISKSQLTSFIENLELGLNTKVGERGVRISGGQLQRVGIARALYRDPQIIILDEATSALDLDTENEFMHSIKNLSKDKTLIIISHRLNTLKECNKIYEIRNKKLHLIK